MKAYDVYEEMRCDRCPRRIGQRRRRIWHMGPGPTPKSARGPAYRIEAAGCLLYDLGTGATLILCSDCREQRAREKEAADAV